MEKSSSDSTNEFDRKRLLTDISFRKISNIIYIIFSF